MNKKRLLITLISFTGLAAILLGLNIGFNKTPVLGLDLQGGISVIYTTAEPATPDDLIVVRDLMRDQLEDFGIAEPDVRVEGVNIIVDLPGVGDQKQAFEALKVSGIVTLRPVLQCQAGDFGSDSSTSGDTGTSDTGSSSGDSGSSGDSSTVSSEISSSSALGVGTTSAGAPFGRLRPMVAPITTPITTPATTPATVAPSDSAPPSSVPDFSVPPDTAPVVLGPPAPTTTVPGAEQPADGQTLLPNAAGTEICLVGPSGGTGAVFAKGSAAASIDPQTGQWVVNVDLRDDGQIVWNALAAQCFSGGATCPSRQLAIVLDDVIQSAPVVQTDNFPGSVQISGAFNETEVRSLARVLNRGAFPVAVVQQRVETVSATAGRDSLNAAVIAGLVGVALLLLFMLWYYKKLSVVIVAGLIVWGMAVFSLASFVSHQTNYALTLAGVTGIIVAVGVTVDTYVVFFERLRDEMRHGRSLRNAAPSSFKSTWRTIISADLVALIASVILFILSVGSVKGFALYLGLTTVCDLLVFYFFTRPAVYLLSMTGWFDQRDRADSVAAIGVVR